MLRPRSRYAYTIGVQRWLFCARERRTAAQPSTRTMVSVFSGNRPPRARRRSDTRVSPTAAADTSPANVRERRTTCILEGRQRVLLSLYDVSLSVKRVALLALLVGAARYAPLHVPHAREASLIAREHSVAYNSTGPANYRLPGNFDTTSRISRAHRK